MCDIQGPRRLGWNQHACAWELLQVLSSPGSPKFATPARTSLTFVTRPAPASAAREPACATPGEVPGRRAEEGGVRQPGGQTAAGERRGAARCLALRKTICPSPGALLGGARWPAGCREPRS